MFNNLKELIKSMPSEQMCIDYLAKQRWENGKAVCPYCNCGKCYVIAKGKKFKCSECRLIFSIRVGTIFQDSNIPLGKWFLAIYLIGSHKKGISSYQVAKDCGVSQKTGWFMLHRIRELMRPKENEKLDNIVEADEVYMGGKVSNMSKSKRKILRETGQTYNTKTMVMGMIERGGNLKLITIGKSSNTFSIPPTLTDNIDKDAVMITDSNPVYTQIGSSFAGHEIVNHAEQEFVKDETIHTNTIEGAFSHFKRSIYGIYHFCTAKHLSRYCEETMFRYNLRKMKDPERFNLALQSCEGRLDYKTLTKKEELSPVKFIGGSMDEHKKGTIRPVIQVKNGQVIATFKNTKAAAIATGCKAPGIRGVLKGKKKTHGGFEWYYA